MSRKLMTETREQLVDAVEALDPDTCAGQEHGAPKGQLCAECQTIGYGSAKSALRTLDEAMTEIYSFSLRVA